MSPATAEVLTQAATALAAEPAGLLPARNQMAFSLGWHIVLACFGVAFPAMIFVVHRRGLRGDKDALELAKRWSKSSAVLFAIGAVSGTVLSFEMGLLWPGLMGKYGDVLGLPFALEGISFFIEAIFLGIYLYGWGRLPGRIHLWMLLPMMLAGIAGTFNVVAVNAWMNDPVGFALTDAGQVTDVNPWAPLLSTHAWLQFGHMWVAAYMVVGFLVAAVYAVGMLRGRRDHHHRTGFLVAFAFASVAALVQPVMGHVLGIGMGERQPAKLAAFEMADTTTDGPSPLRIGGWWVDGEARYTIDIPIVGSIVAEDSLTEPVRGMDTIPEDERPPVNLPHYAFQTMIAIGSALALGVLVFWIARRRGRDLLENRWFLRAAVLAGPLAVVALEAGWTATEVGRQPWVVQGYLKTVDAATERGGLWWIFGITLTIYALMTIAATVVLRSMARRWRSGENDLPSPYGPDRSEEAVSS